MLRIGGAVLSALTVWSCAASLSRAEALPELRRAIHSPVSSDEQNADNSKLVARIVEDRVLEDMTRGEVRDALGRGEPCSRHPRCGELGFASDDWYYLVGDIGDVDPGRRPVLIVGFDRHGRVDKLWNLRVH